MTVQGHPKSMIFVSTENMLMLSAPQIRNFDFWRYINI